jgi:NNP family nitrate/nitrite transporter-like MFS transporter
MMAPMLPGVIFGILAGVMADKYGVKKVVTIGFLISVIGAVLRIFSMNFASLFIFMFLLGFGAVFVNANASKIFSAWFPMDQIGIAMGVFMSAGATGTALSQATGAMFSSSRVAFISSAAALGFFLVIWMIFIREKPEGAPDVPSMPVTKYLGQAAKSRNVWILGLGLVLFMGFQMTFASFLPSALTSAKGIDAVQAGLIASLFTFGGLAGNIFGPILSARIGVVKPVGICLAVLGGVFTFVAWSSGIVAVMAVGFILGGFCVGACVPMLMSYPPLLPEVGPLCAGSAGGIVSTLQMAGAFIVPTYIITPISNGNFNTMFLMASICGALIAMVVICLPELGRKALEVKASGNQ